MLLRYLISQPAVNLDISATTLPYGVLNQSYSYRLTAFGGVPPYKETQSYVQKVLGFQRAMKAEA